MSASTAPGVEGDSANAPSAGVLGKNTAGGPGLRAIVNNGIAPLSVNSSTKVTSLNADFLDGIDGSVLWKNTGNAGFASAASVVSLGAQVNGLASAVSNLQQFVTDTRNEARRGIAAAAANAPLLMPSAPGRTTVSAKVAGYRGQAGAGFIVAHRLDTALPAVIFGSYSNGGGNEHVGRAGVAVEF